MGYCCLKAQHWPHNKRFFKGKQKLKKNKLILHQEIVTEKEVHDLVLWHRGLSCPYHITKPYGLQL